MLVETFGGITPNSLLLTIANGSNPFFSADGVVVPGTWQSVGVAHDGSGSTNADKVKVYVSGSPVTLNFISGGTLPTSTSATLAAMTMAGGVSGRA